MDKIVVLDSGSSVDESIKSNKENKKRKEKVDHTLFACIIPNAPFAHHARCTDVRWKCVLKTLIVMAYH